MASIFSPLAHRVIRLMIQALIAAEGTPKAPVLIPAEDGGDLTRSIQADAFAHSGEYGFYNFRVF